MRVSRSNFTIALDATYAAHPQPTGIGIYSQRLIAALGKLVVQEASESPRFTLAFRPGPYLRDSRRMAWPQGFGKAILFDKWLTWPRAQLFHGLNQRLPERRYPRTVVTLHEHFPALSDEFSTAEFRAHMGGRIERALARADRIIAVSGSVRQHLSAQRPELAAKIRVVHHGVSTPGAIDEKHRLAFLTDVLRLDPAPPFFLNVGGVQVRKNLKNIVLALESIRGAHLVIAGDDGYGSAEIREFIRQRGLSNRVHFAGHRQAGELQMLYASAAALVFPSLEEAFGMPVLEAMSCRCPVITSNLTALPEVAGGAALLVDPKDLEQLRQAMSSVLKDADLAAHLRERGLWHVTQFSWERCAKETWAVYQELM